MRLQEEMIARVRQLCHADERVVAALMYGSFTKGEGDGFSDIEFYLFIR
ncbi:MAG TPA: lincosamide nucleotidyltransferase Lnu(B), partial [Ardenticatenaceae bacterium]|nr:lincosamide nucleotidyltransferase Lnu(B) [Ardenticatenaceae bacterium]